MQSYFSLNRGMPGEQPKRKPRKPASASPASIRAGGENVALP